MRRKVRLFLLVALITLTLLLLVSELMCRSSSEDCKCAVYQFSRDESIRRNLYVKEYYPVKKNLLLKQTTDTIQIDSAWSEYNSQSRRTLGLCLFSNKIKADGYHICIPLKLNSAARPFSLKYSMAGNERFYDYYTHNESQNSGELHLSSDRLPDTLKVVLQLQGLETNIRDTVIFTASKK